MTPAGRRALAILVDLADEPVGTARSARGVVSASDVARRLWPDSPAWKRRTRRHDGRNGAVGGTMPMRAGVILAALAAQGAAARSGMYGWRPTSAGRLALEPVPGPPGD